MIVTTLVMSKSETKSNEWTLTRTLPYILIIGSVIGAISSAILTVELLTILKDPHYVPVCNLNPVLSCSSVTTSAQASAFGFPNEFLGLIGFGILGTIGAGMLAGAKYARWFWKLTSVGLTLAVIFLTWLQFQTLYRIGALCLFCMCVWAVTIPMFWYTLLYNLKHGNIDVPKKWQGISTFAQKHHGDVLIVWILLIIILILNRFWYYWSTLI